MCLSPQELPVPTAPFLTCCCHRSDADADVLADYVLALLRHDGDTNTVHALCEAEIPDFLKEDSAVFVQDVFDAIHHKLYLPGAIPPPQALTIPFAPPSGPSALTYGVGVAGAPLGPQSGSRKRSYNDRGDGDAQDRGYQPGGDPHGRVYKQARRGGNIGGPMGRGNFGGFNNRGGFQGRPDQGFLPGMPEPPPGMPPLDPNNPMAAILAMQAMGFPVPGLPSFPQPTSDRGPSMPKKKRCRDYDLKGFCARGNTCMYEHGQDSIYVPPGNPSDEYDPSNSSLAGGFEGEAAPPAPGHFRGGDRGRGRGGFRGDRGGQFNNPNRRGGRAEFSSDRPNSDKSKTTIVVENIPEEKFSEDEVRAFFSDFGEIVEVSMRPYKRLAIVKFSDWNAAKAAYSSPKVIFDNRFVKVYWYTDQESLPQPPAVSTRPSNGDANGMHAPIPARATSEPQIDIEEFSRKQQEVQKAHEEKAKKKQEMDAARKELERRQEELLRNQAEEKRKLMEKIAAKTGQSAAPGSDGKPGPVETKSNAQTDALKAQLAALEAEAQSLGIDTSVTDDAWGGRGRGRGRGRAGYPGRGAFVPRGFRGGYRGRGGAPFVGGASPYKLDNRTKTVGLTGVDFTNPEKDESLRQYLLVSPSQSLPSLTQLTRPRASASTPTSKPPPPAPPSPSRTASPPRNSCTAPPAATSPASARSTWPGSRPRCRPWPPPRPPSSGPTPSRTPPWPRATPWRAPRAPPRERTLTSASRIWTTTLRMTSGVNYE
jgi:RNA-binding protein 26